MTEMTMKEFAEYSQNKLKECKEQIVALSRLVANLTKRVMTLEDAQKRTVQQCIDVQGHDWTGSEMQHYLKCTKCGALKY